MKNKNIKQNITSYPLVSVLMSVYNTNSIFLSEAIESILNQTYTNFEFLIVDDNSNEETKKILKKYEELDNRIRIYNNVENKGLTKNLNFLINNANGKYLARMDSDDISIKTRFFSQVYFMENNVEYVACGSNYYILDNDRMVRNKIIGRFYPQIKARLFFENSGLMHASIMMRREFFNQNGLLYDENIKKSQDFDLWYRVCDVYKMYIMKDYLAIYRKNLNQISNKFSEEQLNFKKNILIKEIHHYFPNITELDEKCYLSICLVENIVDYKTNYKFYKKLKKINKKNNVFDVISFNYYMAFHFLRLSKKNINILNSVIFIKILYDFIKYYIVFRIYDNKLKKYEKWR